MDQKKCYKTFKVIIHLIAYTSNDHIKNAVELFYFIYYNGKQVNLVILGCTNRNLNLVYHHNYKL